MLRSARVGAAALCAAACVAVGSAAAGETTHPSGLIQSLEVERENGVVEVYLTARRADGAQTPPHTRILVELPERAEPGFGRFGRCRLARLQAFGAQGCPPVSRVGHGKVHGSYMEETVGGRLTLFNGARIRGRRTLLVLATPDKGPAFVIVGKWTRRAGGAWSLDLSFPIAWGYGPQAVLSAYEYAFDRRRGGLGFLRARCGGRWSASTWFATGAVVSSADHVACR